MARRKNMQRRRTILSNTFDLIRQEGLESVSFHEIAKRSGISKSLLQSYYPHKSDLIVIIIRNIFHTLGKQFNDHVKEIRKQPFAFVKSFVYTIVVLGEYDRGIDRIITEVFTESTILFEWCHLLNEQAKDNEIFTSINPNDREVEAGGAFITTGMVRLYCNRDRYHLTPEGIADYTVSAFMFSFMHCSAKKVNSAMAAGAEIDRAVDVEEVYDDVDTMFAEGKTFLS